VRIWPALAADVICILVFAIVGRTSHAESSDLLGVLHTAWPFLAGYLVGLLLSRGWRRPLSQPVALSVWVATVVGGMALRLVSGAGVALSFVVVTAVVLGVMLLGWRGVLSLVHRARSRAGHSAAA
jgi:FtsH-binding integral membrane protein